MPTPPSHRRTIFSPWEALQQLREEVDGLIGSGLRGSPEGWAPPIDLEERDSEFILTAELPGLRPEEIDLEIEGDNLTLRGEKREDQESEEGDRYYLERRYGSFVRRITLPRAVEADRVRARFEHGILRVTMPKREARSGTRVQIEDGR